MVLGWALECFVMRVTKRNGSLHPSMQDREV